MKNEVELSANLVNLKILVKKSFFLRAKKLFSIFVAVEASDFITFLVCFGFYNCTFFLKTFNFIVLCNLPTEPNRLVINE